MKRLCLSLLLTSLSLSAFAASKQSANSSDKKAPCDVTRNPIPLYETFDNKGYNVGVRADFLYMIYQVPVLTYASEQTVISQVLHSNIINVPGRTSVGCELALTYTMPNQPGYSFEFGWYHIVPKFSRHLSAPDIVPAHSVALTLPAPGTADLHAHIAINLFDLLIKKDFAFGDWVSFTPAAGIAGGYMDGVNSAHFVATSGAFSASNGSGGVLSNQATLTYTTKFEGIGLRLGGCSSFKIGMGFKLKADLFYSVLYGFAKANMNYTENGLTVIAGGSIVNGTLVNYSQHHSRSFFDSLLGVAWERRFRDDSLFMDLHVGWRFQTFLDGWKEFEAELDDSLHELALQGQGLEAGATFKF